MVVVDGAFVFGVVVCWRSSVWHGVKALQGGSVAMILKLATVSDPHTKSLPAF